MAKSKGKALGILALIIGISGLGLGGYSLYNSLRISSQITVPEDHQVISRVFRASSYLITPNLWHTVNFDESDFNVGNNFDLSIDSFNCTYAGYYLISGKVTLELLQDGERMLVAIARNTTTLEAGTSTHASHLESISAGVVDILYLNEGDLIQLRVYHTDSISRNVFGNSYGTYTYFSITLIED